MSSQQSVKSLHHRTTIRPYMYFPMLHSSNAQGSPHCIYFSTVWALQQPRQRAKVNNLTSKGSMGISTHHTPSSKPTGRIRLIQTTTISEKMETTIAFETSGICDGTSSVASARYHAWSVCGLRLQPYPVRNSGALGIKARMPVTSPAWHWNSVHIPKKRWNLLSVHAQYGHWSVPSDWQWTLQSWVMWHPVRHFMNTSRSSKQRDFR